MPLPLLCLGLAALNLALNLGQYVGYQEGPVRFDAEVGRLARALLDRGTFADPFGAGPTGPSAHTPPVFPFVYAAYVWLLGTSPTAWVTIKLAAGVALSTWVGLLPAVSVAWGWGRAPGVIGALLAAGAALRHFPEWEANYAALLFVVLAIVAAPLVWGPAGRRLTHEGSHVRRPWVIGLLWGVAMHVNAVALLLFAAWAGAVCWRGRAALSRGFVMGAVLLPVLLLAPWTLRNWLVLGRPIVVRGNLGLELAVSNNPCARAGLLQNLESGCFASQHPDMNADQAARMRTVGEPAYHAERFAEARDWMWENPARFARLTGRRAALYWFPSPRDDFSREWWESTPPRRARIVWTATVLMVIGFAALARIRAAQAIVLVTTLALASTLYYPVQFEDRYRYPIMWITFLLAGYALERAWAGARASLGGVDGSTS